MTQTATRRRRMAKGYPKKPHKTKKLSDEAKRNEKSREFKSFAKSFGVDLVPRSKRAFAAKHISRRAAALRK